MYPGICSIYFSFGSEYSVGAEATIIAAIMVTTLIVGLFLVLLARLKLGNLVRYIPYPVTGGFFAGIGYIFVEGGLTVASSREPTFSAFSETEFVRLIIPAVLLALCLIIGKLFRDNRFAVPGILLLSIVIFYGVLIFSGISPEEAAANGLLPFRRQNHSLDQIINIGEMVENLSIPEHHKSPVLNMFKELQKSKVPRSVNPCGSHDDTRQPRLVKKLHGETFTLHLCPLVFITGIIGIGFFGGRIRNGSLYTNGTTMNNTMHARL